MLVKPHEYVEKAFGEQYALAALDVFDMATIRGVVSAAEELRSPVILQFMQEVILKLGAKQAYAMAACVADESTVPVILHLDHGQDMDVIQSCIEAGFTSVMVDASHEPYERNVETSREVVEYAHKRGVWVEAGLGPVFALPEMALEKHDLTDPGQVADFVQETAVDALAVAVGTVHGSFTGQEYLRFELLQAIEKEAPDLPLVIHGASGVAEKHIKKAAETHVVKVSAGTEIMEGYAQAVEAWLKLRGGEQGLGMTELFGGLEERVRIVAQAKIRLMGSAERV